MKIGILTYHRSHNYGACLQGYALASWIRDSTGAEAELIDYNMRASERFYRREVLRGRQAVKVVSNVKRHHMFRTAALAGFPLSAERLVTDRVSAFKAMVEGKYDMIVVGSDEVWKLGFRGFPNPYFLPHVEVPHKLGYGISACCDFSALDREKRAELKRYLDEFKYIGVRDRATQAAIAPYTAKNRVRLNCDPTFNFDFKPDVQHGKAVINSNKRTVGFMMADSGKARAIMERFGDKYHYIALYDAIPGARNLCAVPPFEWIDILSACDFLVTSYFHGMCFAIKGNVPFVMEEIRGGRREASKSFDILSECGMEERFFMKEELSGVDPICDIMERDLELGVDFTDAVVKQKSKARSFLDELDAIKRKS